ncbi:hypothetical protein MANY_22320 [Mycolicibacterium anyangense]|jgi:hypothetical protein|uniref:Uncharacterized protein n=1 Tax=Mycolicibacterium anyangense TaxID=1431246 RepID=A0A6N4W853_9MYCO|nr:hypothetical protein [Mycolicibacterium anyangense]BBZ76895.1 hypothetical protein MANY_22320 [Mycolicibacterium anyangense]
MTKRKWQILGAVLFTVVAVGGLLLFRLNHDSSDDCATVRAMIAYNKQFSAVAGSNNPEVADIGSYERWARQLHTYADGIHNQRLAESANNLASLADRTVTVVQEFRAEQADPSTSQPPHSVQDYARVGQQFHDDLATLNQYCPG